MPKRAFTLTELLVAAAIIGVILLLLLPALGRVKEEARRAKCANNLRQHGIAWYLYLDDHDELFPALIGSNPGDTQCNPWTFGGKYGFEFHSDAFSAEHRPLNRYLDIDNDNSPNIDLFHCPDDKKTSYMDWLAEVPGTEATATTFDIYGTSYSFNSSILTYGKADRRPLHTITNPHNKVYMEKCIIKNYPGHGGSGSYNWKSMALFVDGHVGGPFEQDDLGSGDMTKELWYAPNTSINPSD